MPKIFVSHAAKDEELVEEFVDLLQVGIGVHPGDIFCSSLPGMKIPTGAAFVEYIKSQVTDPAVVLLLISTEFLKSQFCNNEVGATWALALPIHPLLVPPTDYSDVRGVLAGTQVGKLNDREALNDLRDDMTERLGLKPFRTSHWERRRDKFLSRLDGLLSIPVTTTSASGETKATTAVSTSGDWLKIGDGFFKADRVEHHGSSKITVHVIPEKAEQEALLKRFRSPMQGRNAVAFAYQNEGGLVQVSDVKSLSEAGRTIWSLELTPQEDRHGGVWNEISYNDYSADDIAEMRVERLLIGVPPKERGRGSRRTGDEFFESMLAGRSDFVERTDECVTRKIVKQYREQLETALCWARLEAVFRLKTNELVENIFDLTLGPLDGHTLHVRFRGQRSRRYQNKEPAMIEIEGDCVLT